MRVSVLGAVERRRRWSREDKVRLVAETFAEGITVKEVGERHGVATSLLFQWRRQARLGLFGYGGSEGFAPVAMIEAGEPVASQAESVSNVGSCSRIEIVLGPDVRVLVGLETDRSALETVLGALRAVGR
jgi:transposase